ncbi:MAG TPA: STAS domain-containing protein [Longimicrobium sp.]|nr:STAS domain-containing protein [Longimicrobium sp.]
MDPSIRPVVDILTRESQALQDAWIAEQLASPAMRGDLITEAELRQQSGEFLELLRAAVQNDGTENIDTPQWAPVRDMLGRVSRGRAQRGFTPTETATFVLSLKRPLVTRLGGEAGSETFWTVTSLLDRLGLFTTEVYQRSREEVIYRQQQELLELSTPVVKLWEGILAVPLIGTLDSARTQVVMESLLQRIVETEATTAIIDITGVPTVDTLVAQHLLKTVAAARLMGADCIISGIRPQIAQTIVHLGVELHGAVTKASLADAISHALRQNGWRVVRPVATS